MHDVERLILAWRDEMLAELPGGQHIVDELEDHLRESIEQRVATGVPPVDAFALAAKNLGLPAVMAGQYDYQTEERVITMKSLRIVATTIIGFYLILMAVQFSAISMDLFKRGVSPYSADGPAAFFTNFLACALSSIAIWLIWRKPSGNKRIKNPSAS